jgi:hypothetical protein
MVKCEYCGSRIPETDSTLKEQSDSTSSKQEVHDELVAETTAALGDFTYEEKGAEGPCTTTYQEYLVKGTNYFPGLQPEQREYRFGMATIIPGDDAAQVSRMLVFRYPRGKEKGNWGTAYYIPMKDLGDVDLEISGTSIAGATVELAKKMPGFRDVDDINSIANAVIKSVILGKNDPGRAHLFSLGKHEKLGDMSICYGQSPALSGNERTDDVNSIVNAMRTHFSQPDIKADTLFLRFETLP